MTVANKKRKEKKIRLCMMVVFDNSGCANVGNPLYQQTKRATVKINDSPAIKNSWLFFCWQFKF